MSLLQRIRCRDKVPSSGMTSKILASNGSGDLIFRLLGLEGASFDLDALTSFLMACIEEGSSSAGCADELLLTPGLGSHPQNT